MLPIGVMYFVMAAVASRVGVGPGSLKQAMDLQVLYSQYDYMCMVATYICQDIATRDP